MRRTRTITLHNNTIANNNALSDDGGGIALLLNSDTASTDLTNNIIWGNTTGTGTCQDIYIDSDYDGNATHGTVILNNNDFNQTTGFCTTDPSFTIDPSNLNVDPQFVDAANKNYHIKDTSPVINKGTAHASLPSVDIDGQSRIVGTAVDMGADEVGIPGAPVLISPNATIGTTAPAYTWNAIPEATQYRIYLINAANPSVPLVNAWYTKEQAGCAGGTGTCSYTPAGSLSDATYKWSMQAKNSIGTSGWSAEKSFAVYTTPIVPKAPTTVSPTGTIAATTPSYTWEAVPGAESYRVYIADTLTPNSPLVNAWYTAAAAGCAGGVGTCSITPAVTLADADYYWAVKGKNGVGEGLWSANRNFKVLTTTTIPGIATLGTPNSMINTSTPAYTWNAVAGATYYRIYVADQTDPNAPYVNKWYTAAEVGCAGGTGTCSITPATTLPDAAYYWWIRAKNVAGQGPWSALKSFTVVTTTTIPAAPTLVTPSGTTTNATPTYTWNAVSNATSYRIYLTDALNNIKINKWYTAAEAGCAGGTGTCSVTPAVPLSNGSYSWQMQGKNIAGTSAWSSGMVFEKQ